MMKIMVALGQATFVRIVHIGMPVMLSIIIYQVVSERGVGMMCVRDKNIDSCLGSWDGCIYFIIDRLSMAAKPTHLVQVVPLSPN